MSDDLLSQAKKLLDRDGDGNPLNDVQGMIDKLPDGTKSQIDGFVENIPGVGGMLANALHLHGQAPAVEEPAQADDAN